MKARGFVQCHPCLHGKFKANLGYIRSFLKNQKQNKQKENEKKQPIEEEKIFSNHMSMGLIFREFLKLNNKKQLNEK